MIAVDTNVVVRLLVADDIAQARRARALFDQNTIWIGTTVILETEWVLRGAYKFSADEIHHALNQLFGLPHVTLGDQVLIVQALDRYKQGLDFADALHLAAASHAEGFATFDRALRRSAGTITTTPSVVSP
jgi:predicted nucleic-acid-binding protein